jgi:hypothetical protein
VVGAAVGAGFLTAAAVMWPAGPAALGAPVAGPPAAVPCSPLGAVRTPRRGSYRGLYGVSALSRDDVVALLLR